MHLDRELTLRMFSSTDIQGALTPLKDVIPNLHAAHARAMAHLKGLDLHDLDACLERLADELKRQRFQTDVRTFAKRVDMLLPNPAAKPFLPDLQALGKVVIACRNRYRDDQLDLRGCGEKVRALIDDHVRAAGIDPRVPPIQLFSVEFKERLDGLGSDRAKASELEQAIKTVLRVKLDDDPAYYQTLSRRLEEIIQKHSDKWAELVEQLLLFRDGMERERADQAARLNLSPVEFAFRNALVAELTAAATDAAAAPPSTSSAPPCRCACPSMFRTNGSPPCCNKNAPGSPPRWPRSSGSPRNAPGSLLAENPFPISAAITASRCGRVIGWASA